MGAGVKRLDKKADRGKNRLGSRKDRQRLVWTWDKDFERESNKKFIRSFAQIGNFRLIVDRRVAGWVGKNWRTGRRTDNRIDTYTYSITMFNCEYDDSKAKAYRKEHKDENDFWTHYHSNDFISPVYYGVNLKRDTKAPKKSCTTRIDAQKDAEQELYKYLKEMVRDMEI
jgi:hypothetical protein